MPTAPLRLCAGKGGRCQSRVTQGRCPACATAQTRQRTYDAPWRALYQTARWRALRRQQLRTAPLCAACLTSQRVTPATDAHHLLAHRGDETLFWDGTLESLCHPCHSRHTGRGE